MKFLFSAALLLLTMAPAKASVATYNPRGTDGAVKVNGWTHLGESDQSSFWYTYWNGDPVNGVFVALKVADKAIGNGYTTITTVMGNADCSGAKRGEYPVALLHSAIDIVDSRTGQPDFAGEPSPPLMDYPLTRGSALADAVKAICDKVSR